MFLNFENKGKWKILFGNELSEVGGDKIWSCKPAVHADFNYDKICITFLRDVLKSWFKLQNVRYISKILMKCCGSTPVSR